MKGMPVVPFRAPAGIRLVTIDRRSGRKVFGAHPQDGNPKSAVIWEAFKPESEPRRSIGKQELVTIAPSRQTIQSDSDFLQATGGSY